MLQFKSQKEEDPSAAAKMIEDLRVALQFSSQKEKEFSATGKRLEELRIALRARFLREVPQEDLELDILRYLNGLGYGQPQILARDLAQHFHQTRPVLKPKDIKALIQRRSEELHSLLESIDFEDCRALAKSISMFPRPKRKRKKPSNEAERQRNKRRAKNRYDRGRKYYRTQAGRIERDFGEAKSWLSSPGAPSGPCLDELFKGGEIKMVRGMYCLQDLLGRGRQKIPRHLPSIHRGRECFYNLDSLLECMRRLLADDQANRGWLPDPVKRRIVLTGIMRRAQDVAPANVRAAVIKALTPFLG